MLQELNMAVFMVNGKAITLRGEGVQEVWEYVQAIPAKATQAAYDAGFADGAAQPAAGVGGDGWREWADKLERSLIEIRADAYRKSGLSVDGARIHAETEMRAAKATHFSLSPPANAGSGERPKAAVEAERGVLKYKAAAPALNADEVPTLKLALEMENDIWDAAVEATSRHLSSTHMSAEIDGYQAAATALEVKRARPIDGGK